MAERQNTRKRFESHLADGLRDGGRCFRFLLAGFLFLCAYAVECSEIAERGNSRMETVKHKGQVYTPDNIVRLMLDFVNYKGDEILGKHIIDNSCGNGAFLSRIVERYCEEALKNKYDKRRLKSELQKFIHGIEIDRSAHRECLSHLDEVALRYGMTNIAWDVENADTLSVNRFDGKMDFVVGNPPYVRVHNLEGYAQVKKFSFARSGMTDLYLVFYEIGFKMMKPKTGKLVYIAPSSWLGSLAGKTLRQHVSSEGNLTGIIDLEHCQPFENATTYTLIARFDNSRKADGIIEYYTYDEERKEKKFQDVLSINDMDMNGEFYISTKESLCALRTIRNSAAFFKCDVKNGFATLADDVFIADDFSFDEYLIPVLKASTGKWKKALFLYDAKGKPLPKERIFKNEKVARYLMAHQKALLKGSSAETKPDWYLYGRTQALKDVFKDKVAINTVIRDVDSIKLNFVPKGSGVYSGLYILSDYSFEEIEKCLKTEEFISYLKCLKHYKSGGYYTFSSKDLECYLNSKLKEVK